MDNTVLGDLPVKLYLSSGDSLSPLEFSVTPGGTDNICLSHTESHSDLLTQLGQQLNGIQNLKERVQILSKITNDP